MVRRGLTAIGTLLVIVVLLMRALEQKVRVPGLIAAGGAPMAGH